MTQLNDRIRQDGVKNVLNVRSLNINQAEPSKVGASILREERMSVNVKRLLLLLSLRPLECLV